MPKRIIGKENAVEALASLCRDYRGTAIRAIRQGGEEVYIPADPTDPDSMLDALSNPEGMMQFGSQGNHEHLEPCYASVNEFLKGENADGTLHKGYLSVDIIAKLVTDLCDRDGRSTVPQDGRFDPQEAANELMGKPDSYIL